MRSYIQHFPPCIAPTPSIRQSYLQRELRHLLPKTVLEVLFVSLAVRETGAWRLGPANTATLQTAIHLRFVKAEHCSVPPLVCRGNRGGGEGWAEIKKGEEKQGGHREKMKEKSPPVVVLLPTDTLHCNQKMLRKCSKLSSTATAHP